MSLLLKVQRIHSGSVVDELSPTFLWQYVTLGRTGVKPGALLFSVVGSLVACERCRVKNNLRAQKLNKNHPHILQ